MEVRDLQPDEFPAAVALLARGFRDNPVPTALFGRDPERRRRCLEAMFRGMYASFWWRSRPLSHSMARPWSPWRASRPLAPVSPRMLSA